MLASIWKIATDHEGESTITFKVPSSELINVVKLNALIQKRLKLDIAEEDEHDPGRKESDEAACGEVQDIPA